MSTASVSDSWRWPSYRSNSQLQKPDNALLIVFARASIDDRITSYAIYNFANSTQESTPSSTKLGLSPLDYTLNLNDNSPGLTIQNGYVFSYSYQQTLPSTDGFANFRFQN